MDGFIVAILGGLLALLFRPQAEEQDDAFSQLDVIRPNPRLNPEMLHDEHAFMKIANELGFH